MKKLTREELIKEINGLPMIHMYGNLIDNLTNNEEERKEYRKIAEEYIANLNSYADDFEAFAY